MRDILTLHGVIVSRIEQLPREEGDRASIQVDIAVGGYSKQAMTTVPLVSVDPYEQSAFYDAQVPAGPLTTGDSAPRPDDWSVQAGLHPPTQVANTLVTISTNDTTMLELLKLGRRVNVQLDGEEYKLTQGDPNVKFRSWVVVVPPSSSAPALDPHRTDCRREIDQGGRCICGAAEQLGT